MIDLDELSREERALYSPAFTGLVVCRAVQGYRERYGQPCPVVVAVLSAVMAIQPSIRAMLPKTISTGLIRWLEENKPARVSMMQNAEALSGVVRLGLLFALQTGTLACDETGALTLRPATLANSIRGGTEDSQAVQRAAYMLGRWLPSSGDLSTVMSLLGVRP